MFFYVWFLLNIVSVRFCHVGGWIDSLSIFIAEWYFIRRTASFFPPFHSPVSGHAGNFQGLFIMIKAATSWGTFVAISPRYMARSEIAGPYSRCMFTLLETTNSFP